MTTTFESLSAGDTIDGPSFAVSRESIRLFCDGSLDYNPLHLDDDYMKGNFGKTNFGGIIMHGMNNFGLITRMLTDWAWPAGAIHRRLETRWVKPVRPGDTIQPTGIVKSKQVTANSRWVLIDVMVRNQAGEKVATGEAMVEFPHRRGGVSRVRAGAITSWIELRPGAGVTNPTAGLAGIPTCRAHRTQRLLRPDSWYMNHDRNVAYAATAVDGGWLGMPVLFLHAANDLICDTTGSRLAEPMRENCSNLTEVVVPSGHWMAQECPVAVNAALAKWLATKLASVWPS